MPKTNPKHQRNRVAAERKQTLSEGSFPTRYLIMALIFIGVVTIVIVVVSMSNDNDDTDGSDLLVEPEDEVVLLYKIWINEEKLNEAELEKIGPKYSETSYIKNVSKTEIVPLGLYNHILGKKQGYTGYFTIEPNLDEDGDGIDDNTGKVVEGYAKSKADYYNVRLTFYVEIKNITKGAINLPSSAGVSPSESSLQSFAKLNSLADIFILSKLF